VSSSRRPAKRASGAKAVAKRATARRAAVKRAPAKRAPVKRATEKRTPAKGRVAKPPAPPKTQTARAARLPAPPKSVPAAPAPSRPAPPARQAFRLAGSASSPLTIKPGNSTAPRQQLELSTKQRPGGPRRLSEVELDEDEVLIDGFDAVLEGVRVRITAVLERTCVYVDGNGDRRLARKIDLWVEANKLPIRRRSLG
jgi:hypothetical protein